MSGPADVTASNGGIAAGRDVNIGIQPEELPPLIEAATAPLERIAEDERAEIGRLALRLGASEGILRAVLLSLGEQAGGMSIHALPGKVAELVAERRALRDRERARAPDPDAALAAVDRALAEAMDAGDDPRTEALLARRRDLRLADAARRADAAERLRAAERDDLRKAAECEAMLGGLAHARLRYRDAAAHFRKAFGLLPQEVADRDRALEYLDRAAEALYRQGTEFGDNAALDEAAAAWRDLIARRNRAEAPLDWAAAQNNLGAALMALGERMAGKERLEEAVVAYQAALAERRRNRVPQDWAITQMNLGNALRALGDREAGTARLAEAVTAYRAALEELTRNAAPRSWALTQHNLGSALASLGEREGGSTRFREAVAAFRAALEERTRAREPLDWASTQNNLGNALVAQGTREKHAGPIEDAVAAYRAALEERTRVRMPLEWASTQANLGSALATLCDCGRGKENAEDAVAAFDAALSVLDPERVPLLWARAVGNQGVILRQMAERDGDLPRALRARDQIAAAEAVMRAAGHLPHARFYAGELPAARALVERLGAGSGKIIEN